MGCKGERLRFMNSLLLPVCWCNWGAVLVISSLTLAGCGDPGPDAGEAGGAFRGVVVADEPTAAKAAADILGRGGSAADAAVALYFALAVTYPSAATLGGGGVCLVNDWAQGTVVALNFPAPRAAPSPGATRPTAVPANVRGMAALHARYGTLDWRMLLAPAERMARFGVPVSRAAARNYGVAGAELIADAETRRVFAPSGRLPVEGRHLIQPDLADTLAMLRVDGAGALYTGPLADRLVAAVRAAGGTLRHGDLRNFAPGWRPAPGMKFGNDMVYFTGPPAGTGLIAGQMWRMLTTRDRYRRADEAERPHLFIEAARRSFAGRERWLADDGTSLALDALLAEDAARAAMRDYDPDQAGSPVGQGTGPGPRDGAPDSTGYVVLDALGGAVACGFTAYAPFGTGKVARGTGILIAPAPGPDQRNPSSLGPMMAINPFVRSFKFAAVGGDGPAGPTAMMTVAAESIIGKGRLDRAMRRPRIHTDGGPAVWVEESADAALIDALSGRGHDISSIPALGRVSAVFCPRGYPAEPAEQLCWAEADPRGHGVASYPK